MLVHMIHGPSDRTWSVRHDGGETITVRLDIDDNRAVATVFPRIWTGLYPTPNQPGIPGGISRDEIRELRDQAREIVFAAEDASDTEPYAQGVYETLSWLAGDYDRPDLGG
jgi:hypothetical protein